jgi:site-specific recombinase XerD
VSFQVFVQSFLDYCHVHKGFADLTLQNYERDLIKLSHYLKANQASFLAMDKSLCREFVANELNNDQSAKTLCRRISAYRSFWDFLIINDQLKRNPWRSIRLPKISRVLPKIIPTKVMINFLDSIPDKTLLGLRNRVVCECLYGIGLRVSELVSLPLDQINLSTGECRVIGKRNKERIAIIGDMTCAVLKRYINTVWNTWSKSHSKTLIIGADGHSVTVRTLQRIVKKCSLEQGINPPLTPHVLRHCYATDLYKGGADISIIKELLGHEHVATTEIYTHVGIDELREVITVAHPHG